MAQGGVGFQILSNQVSFVDSASLDSFSRLRVSSPVFVFDSHFSYDLQPLLWEQIVTAAAANVSYDSTNGEASLSLTSAASGNAVTMQTYDWFYYQPGRSQLVLEAFNFNGGFANTFKFVGIGDGNNGIQLEMNGTSPQLSLYSTTQAGNSTIAQSIWNIDPMNGSGPSGLTFNTANQQIFVIDFQGSTGRIRCGLNVGGSNYYFHQFNSTNINGYPALRRSSMPLRAGMSCNGTVSSTMVLKSASVTTESGLYDSVGYPFAANNVSTQCNTTGVHLLSIRPAATFNGLPNRQNVDITTIEVLNQDLSSPLLYQLVLGQAIVTNTTFANVNTTYSGMQYNWGGTISGAAAIVITSGTVAPLSKEQITIPDAARMTFGLDHTAAVRTNGTLSLIGYALDGTANCVVSMNWLESR